MFSYTYQLFNQLKKNVCTTHSVIVQCCDDDFSYKNLTQYSSGSRDYYYTLGYLNIILSE